MEVTTYNYLIKLFLFGINKNNFLSLPKNLTFMKSKILFAIFLLTNSIYAQTFQWAKNASSTKDADGKGIVIGANNSIFSIGDFTDAINFTATDGISITPASTAKSGFLAKYDSNGNYVWHKTIQNGGTAKEATTDGIAKDANDNIFVTGKFISSATVGGTTLTSATAKKAFYLVKFDSSGNVLWSFAQGGTGTIEVEGKRVTTDASGNAYVTGKVKGGSIAFGTQTLVYSTETTGENGFVAKFSPTGALLWANTLSNTTAGKSGVEDIKVANDGKIYIVGKFDNPVTIGSGTTISLTPSGGENFYVAKLDANGNALWAKGAGANSGTNKNTGKTLVIGTDGSIYINGDFENAISFDDSGDFDYINTGKNSFLAKWSANGVLAWVKPNYSGSVSTDEFKMDDLEIDANNNILAIGKFTSTVNIGGLGSVTSAGGKDTFILKYNSNGVAQSVGKISGALDIEGKRLALDANGNAIVSGSYKSEAILQGISNLTYNGGSAKNFFIAKYGAGMTALGIDEIETKKQTSIKLYPNPTVSNFDISWDANTTPKSIQLFNTSGQAIATKIIDDVQGSEVNFNIENQASGLYIVQVNYENAKSSFHKILKK
jgi:hypothetical protein